MRLGHGAGVARVLIVLLLFALLPACARIDSEQARVCQHVTAALEPSVVRLRIRSVEPVHDINHALRINFVAIDPDGEERSRFVLCQFGGGTFSNARLRLIGVATEDGHFGAARLLFLERFWFRAPGTAQEAAARIIEDAPTPSVPYALAYFVQALVNGLPGAAILALLATAYALLYGLSERINLAFGDLAIVGAYAALAAVTLAALGGGADAVVMVAALVTGTATAALAGQALGASVVQPLVRQPGRMLLVATIGVSLVIQEGLRLAQGSSQRWLQPILADRSTLMAADGFGVHMTIMQGATVAGALSVALLGIVIMRITRFGRAWRALADDALAARLCGIDPARVLRSTMLLAGALTGVGGVVLVFAYGNAHYAMGTMLGLKAIVAAILGGIGSVPGACLGGLLIGLFEGVWSAYLPIVHRDIAVYALLSVFLVLRPGGLLGTQEKAPRQV